MCECERVSVCVHVCVLPELPVIAWEFRRKNLVPMASGHAITEPEACAVAAGQPGPSAVFPAVPLMP